MRQLSRWMVLLILLAVAASPALAAKPQESPAPAPSVYENRYDIRYMDLHAAEVLGWEQCTRKDRCRVRVLAISGEKNRKGILEIVADTATHEKVARALVKADATPKSQVFQMVLLAGGQKSGVPAPTLSASAQKALDDLRGFLPYKSYEVLDTGWYRTTQNEGTNGRILGPAGISFRVDLVFQATGAPEDNQLFLSTFRLVQEAGIPLPPAPPKEGSNEPAAAPVARPTRILIDTSFGLKAGETVVVGTSRVDGTDEALVVLLTAVPEGGRS